MALDPLDTWKEELEKLPQSDVPAVGSLEFAGWYKDRIINIETDSSALDTSAGFTFTFNFVLFAALLKVPPPVDVASVGVTTFALSWQLAMVTTIYPALLNVAPGAFIGAPTPPNLFSVINSVVIDPPSLAAGFDRLVELAESVPAETAKEADLSLAMKEATELLTITVVGLDSTPSPAGPLPLTAANVPLI
jgi:hypothetical protein